MVWPRPASTARSTRARQFAGGALVAAIVATFAATAGNAATSSTVVTATIPSATTLVTTLCQSSRTDQGTGLGVVLPGTVGRSSSDCTITFGSSNNTAMLRMGQVDGVGRAMHSPADGTLDATFGAGGVVTFDDGVNDYLTTAIQQPDGKLLVAGTVSDQAMVARLLDDGSLDPAWGTGGITYINAGGTVDRANGLALEPDGDVIVAGGTEFGDWEMFVARLDSDGDLDVAGFGVAGIRHIDPTAGNDTAFTPYLDADGGIVLAAAANGTAMQEIYLQNGRFAVARVTATGALDTTWGASSGWTIHPTTNADVGRSSIRHADGRIMLVAHHNWNVAIGSFGANGLVDQEFGGGTGRVERDLGGDDWGQSIVAAPDGGAYVVGNTDDDDPNYDVYALKVTTSGAFDATWGGGDGIADYVDITGDPYDDVFGASLQPTGRLLVFGHYNPAGADDGDLLAVGYEADGTLSSTFGANGIWTQDVSTDDRSTAGSVTLDDGRVVMLSDDWNHAYVVMFDAASIPDYDADGEDNVAGNADDDDFTTASANLFGACLRAVGGAGVGGTWTVDPGANCAATDADAWYSIPASTSVPAAKVAQSTTATTTNATATLNFAFRAAPAQRRGAYVAPLVLEVIAPNA